MAKKIEDEVIAKFTQGLFTAGSSGDLVNIQQNIETTPKIKKYQMIA